MARPPGPSPWMCPCCRMSPLSHMLMYLSYGLTWNQKLSQLRYLNYPGRFQSFRAIETSVYNLRRSRVVCNIRSPSQGSARRCQVGSKRAGHDCLPPPSPYPTPITRSVVTRHWIRQKSAAGLVGCLCLRADGRVRHTRRMAAPFGTRRDLSCFAMYDAGPTDGPQDCGFHGWNAGSPGGVGGARERR